MSTATLTKPAAKGGSFRLESPQPGDVFTPADLADDQKLMGQTAEEFVVKEVLPLVKDLENKKPGLMPALVKKAGEVGLMGGGVPEEYGGAGLDKIATTVLTEKLSIYGGFAVTHGAHAGIGTLPIVYFGTEAQKKKYLPKLATGEWIGRGHIVAFNILNAGRFTLGASCVGGAKHVLATASKYTKERKAFGKQIGDFGMMKEKLAKMAIQILAVESMVYRSAGNIEGAMHAAAGSGDKIQNTMKVLEEYAIESSIAKVYGSEMLDFVVDEAVQIFGGYGFHEEYPVCRAYRDSRINRIFEGTNEINRMLIVQMLMKRAMAGQLPLIPAAMKLADEILSGPSFEDAPEGVLAEETRVVANAKKMFLQAAGGAVQKFREKLADEQELVAALANVVMEIYAMESCLLRAQKAATAKGEAASKIMVDTARVFISDAMERIEHDARRALAAVHEGDMLTTQMAVLKRFGKRPALDTIALRRGIAAAVQSQDRYPFEGR